MHHVETQRTFVQATGRVVELQYDADTFLYTIVTYGAEGGSRRPHSRALEVRYCTSPSGVPAIYAAAVTAAGGDETCAPRQAAA